MRTGWALLVLLLAAALEAGGDALVRAGLFGPHTLRRTLLIAAGGLVLLAYGCVVNAPRWDFGRLLGIYVVFFFVAAQLIDWVSFQQRPTSAILVGGLFIVIGGLIISLWRG